jgi:hypothetical protein
MSEQLIKQSVLGVHDGSLDAVKYSVSLRKVYCYASMSGLGYRCEKFRAIVRDSWKDVDTCTLGMVRAKHYNLVQNADMVEVAESLATNGGLTVERAFTVRGGEKAYILLRLPSVISVANNPKDTIQPYILLHNSFDGKSAFGFAYTALRVCCANQLPGLGKSTEFAGSFSHVAKDPENWKAAMSKSAGYIAALSSRVNRLAETEVGPLTMSRLIRECIPSYAKREREKGDRSGIDRIIDDVFTPSATNNYNTLPSAWNLANGITRELGTKASLAQFLSGAQTERVFSIIERELGITKGGDK